MAGRKMESSRINCKKRTPTLSALLWTLSFSLHLAPTTGFKPCTDPDYKQTNGHLRVPGGHTCILDPGNHTFLSADVYGTVQAHTDLVRTGRVVLIVTNTINVRASGVVTTSGFGYLAGSGPGAGVVQGNSGSGGECDELAV